MIRIGQKHKRGISGDKNTRKENFINIDVTSGSRNKINSKILSPMLLGPIIDKYGLQSELFENYWQGGKLWEKAGHISSDNTPSDEWFTFRKKVYGMKKGKRRPLPIKKYGVPCCSYYNNRMYDYIESRKEIYVTIYYNLIKDLPIIQELRTMLNDGYNIMIIDGDGPPKSLYPEGLELNEYNWNMMLNDEKYPFGHGYIVGRVILDSF